MRESESQRDASLTMSTNSVKIILYRRYGERNNLSSYTFGSGGTRNQELCE